MSRWVGQVTLRDAAWVLLVVAVVLGIGSAFVGGEGDIGSFMRGASFGLAVALSCVFYSGTRKR